MTAMQIEIAWAIGWTLLVVLILFGIDRIIIARLKRINRKRQEAVDRMVARRQRRWDRRNDGA